MSRRWAVPWSAILALLSMLAGAAPAVAEEALAARQNAQVTFLHLADVYAIAPVDGGKAGGLARVAALERRLAAERETVVTLAGDFLSPSVASSIFRGEQMMAALGAMGLDLATLGNHEFDFGPELLRQRMAEAGWRWVVSNLVDEATGAPLGGEPPYLVREHGSLRVGYLGLCLVGEEISPRNRRGVSFRDPFAAAAEILPRIEEEGVDAIVAITHLDYADDVRLAQRFPQIDLILGGHEHFPITAHVGSTLIVKPGSDARYVARLDLGRTTADGPLEKHFELVAVNEDLGEEVETARVVGEWEERLDRELDVAVGASAEPLDAVAQRVRSAESNLGNLLADAMRRDTGAEIAILNGGSIRSNRVYPAGELRRRDLVAIHPFGGVVCEVSISGEVVRQALEHGMSRLGESVGRFPQVSGIRLRVDPERPPGGRVLDVEVGGEPLDPGRTYSVAIGDYMLAGGDGYGMLATGEVRRDEMSGSLLVNALEAYVREAGEIAPRVDGRILFAGEVAAAAPRRPVILDTDMGIDSVMGLLYLLKAPEVVVEGVTVVHGIADLKAGVRNARRILELTGDSEVPVAAGRRRPLNGRRAFPAFWKPQANSLGGAQLPAAGARRKAPRAWELIPRIVERVAEPVTLIAMGPLTNIALALERMPDAAEEIREIVVMGGALEVDGNVGHPYVGIDNTVAEWNFYLDPEAAERVLASGIPVRLLPLDSTLALPLTPELVDRVRARPRDQTSALLLALLESVGDGIDAGWYYFWDVLAAVAAARPEILGCREEWIEVVTADGPSLGRTRAGAAGSGHRVCVGEEINRRAFEDHFLESIFR